MIPKEKQYEHITSQLQYFGDRMRDSFKLYIQIVTAVAGGSIWLLSNNPEPDVKKLIGTLGPPLILFLGVFLPLQIVFDYQCWFGYAKAKYEITKGDAPSPKFPDSAWTEIFFVAGMAGASAFGAFSFWDLTGSKLGCHWVWACVYWLLIMIICVCLMGYPSRKKDSP